MSANAIGDQVVVKGKAYNFTEFIVLVANENKFMSGLIIQMLKGFGVKQVIVSRNSEEAIGEIAARKFDFLLIDIFLEPKNGTELIKEIRSQPGSESSLVPIIVITGHSQRNNVEAARDSGANEFLTIPLSAACLFDRIVSLIENVRPFVKTANFFGPDRRRGRREAYAGPFRRATDAGRPAARIAEVAEKPVDVPAPIDEASAETGGSESAVTSDD